MNVGKRAVLYLVRKKSKSIALLVVLTILSTLIMTGVAIGHATDTAIENLYHSLGGYFKVETNLETATPEKVTDALVADIMKKDGISAYNGMDLLYLVVQDIQLEPGRLTFSGEDGADLARVLGNTDSSLNEYFALELISLKEGRHIQADDVGKAVISDILAERNNLSIGDTFSLAYSEDDLTEEELSRATAHELEVVGIYEIDSTQNQDDSSTAECDMVANFIFTDTAYIRSVIEEINESKRDFYTRGAAFFVTNPRELDAIVSSLSEITGYDWDGITITENNKTYQETAIPLVRLSGFLSTLVLVILLISVVILSLILFLWMKDRIHEIGIFLSIGIRKTSIVGQHILENLMVAVLAFVVAVAIFSCAANQVEQIIGNTMSESTETVGTGQSTGLSAYDSHTAEQLLEKQDLELDSSIEIQLGIAELMEILGIEVLVVILSTGLSSVVVLRMRPRDILSSMS